MDEYDVLVIGAGMGGAAISKHLGEAGMKVVCLEQGDWVHPADHPHYHNEWETERHRGWALDPNVRKAPEDYPITGITTPYMYNAVGGSTAHMGGHWPRFKPVDFRKGTEHGLEGTIDWPMSYEDLAPFYAMNDAEIGVSGFAGDPAMPPRTERYSPAPPPGKVGHRVAAGFDKLGWHWWPADNAILTRGKDGRLPCNFCGDCESGCPRGSIGTGAAVYWPKALAAGVRLITNARVEKISLNSRGLASGAIYIDRATDARHEIKARIVVLCANGIGTPRMLLMSAQAGHPDGLANSNGLVGTHLMHHTWAFTDCWYEDPLDGYKGNRSATVYSTEFYDTKVERGFVNGFSIQVGRSAGPASISLGSNAGKPLPWGDKHRQAFDERFGHHMLIYTQGEDLPIRTNRVTLDTDATDSSGLPGANVEYKLCDNDVRLTDFGTEQILRLAEAAGGLIKADTTGTMLPPPGFHLMGSCRMGNTAEDSVTNKYNQTWDVPNLFIADGSSLTTGGAVNPTSTIGAVALRCAEYIKRSFSDIVSQTTTPSNADGREF
jgi:choline dehydrogenase-like flavoprotein